jgi:hypothetical protein
MLIMDYVMKAQPAEVVIQSATTAKSEVNEKLLTDDLQETG